MKALLTMILFATGTNLLAAQNTKALEVKEYTLDNGLTVWLNEDHSQPKIFGAVVVKAGSKDCPDTGIAHYFEHMMFKGTDKIGTIDYEAEKVLLDSITARYDELAATEDEAERARIQKEINELSIQSSDYVIPNEFNRLISKYGGSGLNAATSYDATVYFNSFSPQYIAQWAEINSERLLNPVFRLFQSELETVYEEKNMYGDFIGGPVMDRLLARYFTPHPYAYPIIGSAKNLKNPRLTEMRKFFEEYYVASNMGLILSGDFDTETVLPILEKTFSRIRPGKTPKREVVALPPFKGKEKMEIKFPLIFLKAMGLGFRGVPADHEDKAALAIAVNMLNNANGTGYLDRLMVERKIMASMAMNESMNEAGILAILVLPKLMFQSYGKAEKLIWKEINRIKEGDFTDEVFNSLKQEQHRQYASNLENIDSRARIMMSLYSQGKSWNDYLEEVSRINALTREDVIRVARKYFSDNYLCVTKKTGKYPKDYLKKPPFDPVVPKNSEATSKYARQLEQLPVQEVEPHFIDLQKDVQSTQLAPLAALYITPNPVTDVFTLNMIYQIGTLEQPKLMILANYLQFLGTDSLPFQEFRTRLQVLGSTLSFDTNDKQFIIRITGFDNHFEETVKLAGDFIMHVKADNNQISQVINEAKVTEKAFFESSDNIANAMLEKVKYGEQSRYLKKLSLSEIKKLKGKDLLDVFADVRKRECDLHYCGTWAADQVARQIKATLPLQEITVGLKEPYHREAQVYDKPAVYFMDMPTASQSIVFGFVNGEATDDMQSRHASRLFSVYFGGDMSSLMFQEIREFRSLAYRVSGRYILPPYNLPGKTGEFVTMLSTQSDKTLDAMKVMNSLICEMPEKPERISTVKQSIVNQVNNDFPSFRDLSEKVAAIRRNGFEDDPNRALLSGISGMNMQDIIRFYRHTIRLKPVVYVIVGNESHIDMEKLSEYGEVIKLKKRDIYK